MAVFKCKMCGGALEIGENQSIATCEFCGTQQTLPKFDDERKVTLFTRANHLRFNCDFDKASGVYESIVTEFPDEAEAYWGLVLCKYGIEYVDDSTGKKIPTCHRTLPTSIMDDEDFSSACDYADTSSKSIYREEAKAIDKIQKKILEIAATEKPYDIFICYKETDEDTGARTEDSSIAQDIYTELIKEGYKVFFSRVTLREVAGTEYEPYIYAALSSAKVMLAIGTKFAYYDAVWVKNEWSRFISMIGEDSSKVLIPCYRNMDAYDMPKEFKNMQALDMGDVTFFASLTANINRLLPKEKTAIKETVVVNSGNTAIEPLLKRAFMFLEDSDFARADDFCEQVLNMDPECAEAYLGKLMVELGINKRESLKNAENPFDNKNVYQKIIRYADAELKSELEGYIEYIKDRNERARIEDIYRQAKAKMEKATEEAFYVAIKLFESISDYKDSSELIDKCIKEKDNAGKNNIYEKAVSEMDGESVSKCENAIKLFESISGWKDSEEKILLCQKRIEEIKERKEKEARERERIAEEARILREKAAAEKAKKKKRIKIAFVSIFTSIMAISLCLIIMINVVIPKMRFKDVVAVDAGFHYTVALKSDGTVVFTGLNLSNLDAKNWTDIVDISADNYHIVGLKSDGTVVASVVGVLGIDYGQCDVSGWTDIIDVSVGEMHTVGLKSDGTVVAVGGNRLGQCDVDGWTDIIAISAGDEHTVGLKSDGTLVATKIKYAYRDEGQCDVSDWTDVVAISAGFNHTVGLMEDGTVVATGSNSYGECDVSDWTDIVAISAGFNFTVGLKSDGTVVATGYNDNGQCNVSNWSDIVDIATGSYNTVGLKSDGTLVAVGCYDCSNVG